MPRGGEGEPREKGFVQMEPGLEVFRDELEKEVEAALDRIGQGEEAEAPRPRAAEISPRIQELAHSEMGSRAKPAQPAAGARDAEPELSWAYRQQLLRAMKRPSPLLAAAAGAAVGSAITLLAVFSTLSPPRAGPPEVRAPGVEAAPAPAAPPSAPPRLETAPAAPPHRRAEPKPSQRPAADLPGTQEENANAVAAGGEADGEVEDELDNEYGGREGTLAREGRPTVFIPPPIPGLPETLSKAEILQVVLAHKPEIVACVRDVGGAAAPGRKRTLVMRWTIEPDGRTSDVAVASAGLERSAVGGCLADEIATWRFPPHSAPQSPIRFPFMY